MSIDSEFRLIGNIIVIPIITTIVAFFFLTLVVSDIKLEDILAEKGITAFITFSSLKIAVFTILVLIIVYILVEVIISISIMNIIDK